MIGTMKKFTGISFLLASCLVLTCVQKGMAEKSVNWFQKGYAHGQKGEYQEAIADYSKALKSDPKNCEAYNNRGFAFCKVGMLEASVEDYSKAIKICGSLPTSDGLYINRGAVYYMIGNHNMAIMDFNEAITRNSKNIMAYVNRGLAYNKLGNSRQAISDLIIAAKLGHEESQKWLKSQGISW